MHKYIQKIFSKIYKFLYIYKCMDFRGHKVQEGTTRMAELCALC